MNDRETPVSILVPQLTTLVYLNYSFLFLTTDADSESVVAEAVVGDRNWTVVVEEEEVVEDEDKE